MIYSDDPKWNMPYEFFEQACLDFDNAMQFSGVKDKNNKDIYEGDIVKYCRFISNGVESWETGNGVVFKRGCFWTGNRVASGFFKRSPLNESYKSGDPAFMYWDNSLCFEVIGNIYENPELIEKDK